MRENGLTVGHISRTSSSVRGVTQSGVDYPDEIRLILFSGQVLDASLWGSNIHKIFPVCESFPGCSKTG